MIRTQSEFNAAIAAGQTDHALAPNADIFVLVGDPILHVTDGQPSVEAYGSSQPRVVAYDSSQPRVEAYDSSQPRVVAYDSSQPRVVAYDSSQPRVEASGSSQPRVVASGSSQPRVVAYDSSHPRVEAYGSSQPRVVASGSSQPRVEAYDSSQPRVEASDSSQPRVVASGSSQPRVVAYDSSQPRVEASGSSQPRVVASGSSQPRVEAYGSSQPRVEAYGSSQPRVEAYGSSQPRVVASGSSQLSVTGAVHGTASAQVAVLVDGDAPQIIGGQQTRVTRATVEQWCACYGVPIRDGVATLYKAVGDDFHTQGAHRFSYMPGTTPVAPDWDGGVRECGGGLHFSPRPMLARKFAREATRFVACPVAVADIAVHQNGQYPEKVKARGCCAPVWECDEDGKAVRS